MNMNDLIIAYRKGKTEERIRICKIVDDFYMKSDMGCFVELKKAIMENVR